MEIHNFTLFGSEGPLLLTPRSFIDHRGSFCETYNRKAFEKAGIRDVFVQDNQSLSRAPDTIRGLHCQIGPQVQGKLVRCLSGRVLDVAVDCRARSPSFGKYISAELSPENNAQLWVPPGFLHGFRVLEENSILFYKCTGFYDPACERSVRFDDPGLNIDWGLGKRQPILSEKDEKAGSLAEASGWFPGFFA